MVHEPEELEELLVEVDVVEAAASADDVFLHELISGATATKPKAVMPFLKNDFRSIVIKFNSLKRSIV